VKATGGEEWCIECASEVGLAFVELRRDVLALVEIARAMERIAVQQPKTLDWLEANGIIFDNMDDHWQKVAFSVYTDLCEMDTIARSALARLDSGATEENA
jgi:hypothetical protein